MIKSFDFYFDFVSPYSFLAHKEIRKIENKVGNLNLDFIMIVPEITRNEEDKTLSINFSFEKSPQNYVDRINVSGNRVTQDFVIRRQFKSVEGDPFNPSEIRNSATFANLVSV